MFMSQEEVVFRGMFLGKGRVTDVAVCDGKVVDISPARDNEHPIGGSSSIIAPPLFDIQVNGAGGINLQGDAVTPEHVRGLTDWLAAWGVSHWVPTIITGPLASMEKGCKAIVEAMQDKTVAQAVPGIHLEGPFVSPKDGPRGAHPKKHVRKPSLREFDRLLKAADHRVLYTTVAPELDGAAKFIREVVKLGILVSLGHHHGTEVDIEQAVEAGATMCTHLGNGMAPEIPRHQNPLWPQLANDHLTASLIADLYHLPPAVLKTFVRAKGPKNVVLTSDCVHLAGCKPGTYELAGSPVALLPEGKIVLSGTDLLAGSALMLLQGVVNAARGTDMGLKEAFASATTIPAKLLGLKHRFTLPSVGRKANFILFEVDTSSTHWIPLVRAVFINGERKA